MFQCHQKGRRFPEPELLDTRLKSDYQHRLATQYRALKRLIFRKIFKYDASCTAHHPTFILKATKNHSKVFNFLDQKSGLLPRSSHALNEAYLS